MPTTYPKCSPSEMTGLLVLLDSHKGDEDVARLADDLDLEIDEILPSLDYAEVLGFVQVDDGRATLTDTGRRLLAGTIRERKAVVREQLRRTTLFRTLMRALENSPEHRLTDAQLMRLVEFTTAPSDEVVQNIVNWGRYAELFRYDSDDHLVVAIRRSAPPRSPPTAASSPSSTGSAASTAASVSGRTPPRAESRMIAVA